MARRGGPAWLQASAGDTSLGDSWIYLNLLDALPRPAPCASGLFMPRPWPYPLCCGYR